MPEEFAQRFVSEGGALSSAQAVVKAMCQMAGIELAAEPLVRQEVRKQYMDTATVSTSEYTSVLASRLKCEVGVADVPIAPPRAAPTPAGDTTLDPFHPLGEVKRLSNKPLTNFEDSDQFLKLLQARACNGWGGRRCMIVRTHTCIAVFAVEQAEREGLITVKFELSSDNITSELAQLCQRGAL